MIFQKPLPPIPVYLNLAMMNCFSSIAASAHAKNGLINWSPALKAKAALLEKQLSEISNYNSFVAEVQKQAFDRLTSLVYGIEQFVDSKRPAIAPTPYKTIWQEGSTSLFDYGGSGQKIFLVPSLINRSYILDLTEKSSLIKFLRDKGFHPFLIDWGEPGKEEKDFSVDDYVKRVVKAIDEIKGKVILTGYCMGGLMALAAAAHRQKKLKGLALLATPWDFHSEDTDRFPLTHVDIEKFSTLLEKMGSVPKELIYLMFYFLDPWSVHNKYNQTHYDDESLLAREYWVHDGVPMAKKVFRNAFFDWSYYNSTMEKNWKTLGKIINPAEISLPTFVGIPAYDRIVPPLCSKPLTSLIPGAHTVSCPSGHIGMIVGKNAREYLWEPMAKWLNNL